MPTLFSTQTAGGNNKLILENAQQLVLCVFVLVSIKIYYKDVGSR